MIPVTKPFLPPNEEVYQLLDGIWNRNWLTNNGPLVNELEEKLKVGLDVPNIHFTGNGTIALQIALKTLGQTGKIITTPFSYVATTSSIVWEGFQPVFADIDSKTLNIDPASVEALIDPGIRAILATHCFGNACDIEALEVIGKKHGIPIIYDAAHCFGTRFNDKAIFSYGDICVTSFHATKVFHTVEGGAIFTKNQALHDRIFYMRNFGHNGPETFNGVGINGKNSEFHAAMGLCNLSYIDNILASRKRQAVIYDQLLEGLPINKQQLQPGCEPNYSYYPVIFSNESVALQVKAALEQHDIFPRRYFYPTLSSLDYIKKPNPTPVADDIAGRILCLPVYYDLIRTEQENVVKVIRKVLNAI